MWRIVADAFAQASPGLRRRVRWMAAAWVVVVVAQAWDSSDTSGPAGAAEFMSAVLTASSGALLGLAYTLQRAMQEMTERPGPAGEPEAVQKVLLALPLLGFTAGVMLGGAALLMVVRVLLGSKLLLAVVAAAVYAALAVAAGRTVTRSAETLFAHATRHAAAAAEARSQAAAAQVSALQARMNPHFLFNALNTVASLVRSDPRRAERVVEDLADVLRKTLDRSAGTDGTVREEIEYVRAYLALEQERWSDRLRVNWEIAPDALDHPLPPLMLQPLVENALRHGLAARLDGLRLRIGVDVDGSDLRVLVEDDGPGFPRGWREGTGLGSVRQRLRSMYGDAASLRVENGAGGARVCIVVPRRRTEVLATR
jgi:signal transduction histidine kinase